MCFLTDLGQTLILVILAVILEFNPTKVGLLNEGCTILIIIVKAVSWSNAGLSTIMLCDYCDVAHLHYYCAGKWSSND